MKKIKVKHDDAQVDVTPMLDIVFIMLIFFIISSNFINEKGIDITQYKDNKNKQKNEHNARIISLKVCSDSRVLIDQRAIDLRSVRANVERKLAEDPNTIVLIESEYAAPANSLIAIIDQVKVTKSNFTVSPKSSKCDE